MKSNHENRLDERLKHKNFGEWQDIFQDNTTSAAILDRILHRSKVVKIVGESYRLKERGDFLTPYTTKAPDVAPMPLIIYIHLSLQTGSYRALSFSDHLKLPVLFDALLSNSVIPMYAISSYYPIIVLNVFIT